MATPQRPFNMTNLKKLLTSTRMDVYGTTPDLRCWMSRNPFSNPKQTSYHGPGVDVYPTKKLRVIFSVRETWNRGNKRQSSELKTQSTRRTYGWALDKRRPSLSLQRKISSLPPPERCETQDYKVGLQEKPIHMEKARTHWGSVGGSFFFSLDILLLAPEA